MKKTLSLVALLGLIALSIPQAEAFSWSRSNWNPANWGHCNKCEKKCDPCDTGYAAPCDPCAKKKKNCPCKVQQPQAKPCEPCQKVRENCDPCEKLQNMNK